MNTIVSKGSRGIRLVAAAIILVCLVVLTGMAQPQVKADLNTNLPPNLSSVQQHSTFTPFY